MHNASYKHILQTLNWKKKYHKKVKTSREDKECWDEVKLWLVKGRVVPGRKTKLRKAKDRKVENKLGYVITGWGDTQGRRRKMWLGADGKTSSEECLQVDLDSRVCLAITQSYNDTKSDKTITQNVIKDTEIWYIKNKIHI